MKFQSITVVSALALMISLPAYADDTSSGHNQADNNGSAMSNIRSGLSSADNSMRATADDIHGFFFGKAQNDNLSAVTLRRDMTVNGLIGKAINNQNGKKVATLRDIIINSQGKAILIVVSDDGVLGIGDKIAAFDFSKVAVVMPDGPTTMVLSQYMIDHAADFSYDRTDWRKSKVIPKDSYSANSLLKAIVVNSDKEKIATIDNIYFRAGQESQFIIGFDKTLGMGGELAMADFSDLKMIGTREEPKFELTARQSAELVAFKKTTAK